MAGASIDYSTATVTDVVPPLLFEVRRQYASFFQSFANDGPIYAMPESLVEASKRQASEWELDWNAELAFSQAASSRGQVGLWHIPIPCEYARLQRSILKEERLWRRAEGGASDVDSTQRRIVGTLLTNSNYLADIGNLKRLCANIPQLETPLLFPLNQHPVLATALSKSKAAKLAQSPAEEFVSALKTLLSKWQLGSLITWDLPFPHLSGPTFYPPNCVAAPEGLVSMQISTTQSFTGKAKAALIQSIESEILARARDAHTPADLVAAASNRGKEGEFWVAWLELVIRQRFAKRPFPRGFEGKLQSVISGALSVEGNSSASEDEVRKRMKKLRAARRNAQVLKVPF